MDKKPKCIFHIPNYIDPKGTSGSQVRPMKMLKAFENIGYEVDVVMGYGKERKNSIDRIKKAIKKGEKYEFLYSESSTMPTLLTEENHFPVYPFLDFGFLKFCRKNGIKVGLFYRDIHWKFSHYTSRVPLRIKLITIPFYYYDIWQYKKKLDVLYVTSPKVIDYISDINKKIHIDFLPPGAEEKSKDRNKVRYSDAFINIFYVGGITGIYEFETLLKVIKKKKFIKLIICCRENEWNEVKDNYQQYMDERIRIVHKTGDELKEYYEKADICSCFFKPSLYMNMAIPIKLLEYVSFQKPILATQNTEAGNFVEKYDCGFCIPYDESELEKLMDELYINKELLLGKYANMKSCFDANTWESRAKKVAKDLSR